MKQLYNEKCYVLLAQKEDGTYIGENGIKDENGNYAEDRVWLFKTYSNESKEIDKKKARYLLRSLSNFSASYFIEAHTKPNSDEQYTWFFAREIAKHNNAKNYRGCSNWKVYRLNSKHCPIKIDMDLRKKIVERKVRYDNVEFHNPKFTLKNVEKLNLLKQQYNDEVTMFERYGATNVISFTEWLNIKKYTL